MTMPARIPDISGLKVLVVEDEFLVAMVIEEVLAEFGCVVAGIATTVAQALGEIQAADDLDVAILDVNLGGEKVFPVADALRARNVPFVFSTGYGPADLARRYPESRLLGKPYMPDALAEALAALSPKKG
jgi:CheY-like chemotaxis protein